MEHAALLATKNWIEQLVIGHQLCPFAKKPFIQQQIRYVVFEAAKLNALDELLTEELRFLEATAATEVETTIIILTDTLKDFYSYWNYMEFAAEKLERLHVEGVLQLASFHPQYQFADTAADDLSNYTNRSPYPLIHILREASLEAVLEHYPNPELIPERNIEKMQQLGLNAILELLKI